MTDDKKPKRMSGAKPTAPKRGRKTEKMDKENATRMMTHKVKTARGRKISSKLWIERQIKKGADTKRSSSASIFETRSDTQFQIFGKIYRPKPEFPNQGGCVIFLRQIHHNSRHDVA